MLPKQLREKLCQAAAEYSYDNGYPDVSVTVHVSVKAGWASIRQVTTPSRKNVKKHQIK